MTNKAPSADIKAPAAVCANSTGNRASVRGEDEDEDEGGGATYVWTIINGSITSGQGTRRIKFTAGASGSVTLNVTVVNAAGCSASGSKTIPINPVPDSTITAPSSVCHDSTGNVASAPSGGADYRWRVTNGRLESGQGTSKITFTAGDRGAVTLKVRVTGSDGCKSTSSKSVPIDTGC
ncbi:MAG: hypothetical protein ACRD1P_04455 [Thermoanaerobaculia bacterium]